MKTKLHCEEVEVGTPGLIWFYGISTTVDYSIPNPFLYKCIEYTISKHITFLKEPEVILFLLIYFPHS